MKAVCIIGSPKGNGNTAFLVDRVISGMSDAGIDVVRYVLGEMNINYCRGCRQCEIDRKCVQIDDMGILLDSIIDSDIVLLASPSYWGDVTGQMKVFIDRSLPLCNAATGETPVPTGKTGVAVAIRAGESQGENTHIVETCRHYFGHLGIELVADLTIEGVLTASDFDGKSEKLEEAYKLGRSLVSSR
jgi:multimeric flavodoxin WrbA